LILKLQSCKVAWRTSKNSRQTSFYRFLRKPETESAKRDQEEESSRRTIITIRNRDSTYLVMNMLSSIVMNWYIVMNML
jgi:hypothetical protein